MHGKLVTRASRLLKAIDDDSLAGPAASRRAARLRAEVLSVLETGERSAPLEKFAAGHHGLKIVVKELQRSAAQRRLAAAVFLRTMLGQNDSQALATTGATLDEWNFLTSLARQTGHAIGSFVREVPPETPWVAQLRGETEEMLVVLEERAAEDMLLAALEAYVVPLGPGLKYTEVYGMCLGFVRQVRAEDRTNGEHVDTYVTVTRCAAQLRARATTNSVLPNERTLKAQLRAARVLFPELEIVGDFHSHPYGNLATLNGLRGWEYSGDDEQYNREWVKKIRREHHHPRVALIVAVARTEWAAAPRKPSAHGAHTFQINIEGYRAVIGAYRILDDGSYSKKRIRLRCTA